MRTGRPKKKTPEFDRGTFVSLLETVTDVMFQDLGVYRASLVDGPSDEAKSRLLRAWTAAIAENALPTFREQFSNFQHCKSRLKNHLLENLLPAGSSAEELVILTLVLSRIPTITHEEKAEAIKWQTDVARCKSRMPVILTETEVKNVIRRLEKGTDLDSASAGHTFVFLQLTSGCRKIELLDPRVSQFDAAAPSDGEGYHHSVVQNGVAKQRIKGTKLADLGFTTRFVKFVPYVPPDLWLRKLRDFRIQIGDLGHLTREEIGSKFAGLLEKATRDIFYWCLGSEFKTPTGSWSDHSLGTHFNRVIYSRLCALVQKRDFHSLYSEAYLVQNALTHHRYDNQRFYERVMLVDDSNADQAVAFASELLRKRAADVESGNLIEGVAFERYQKKRRTEKMKRLMVKEAEERLVAAGVNPTIANLRRLGIGTTTLVRFHDKTLTSKQFVSNKAT